MLGDTRGAEIVRHAADRNDQRIVAEHARRNDLPAVLIDARRDVDLPPRAIEADHLPDAVTVVGIAGVGDQLERIGFAVERTGRHLMQKRLPHVDARPVEEGDRYLVASAERATEGRGKIEAGSPGADDEHAMQRDVGRRRCFGDRGVVGAARHRPIDRRLFHLDRDTVIGHGGGCSSGSCTATPIIGSTKRFHGLRSSERRVSA